MKKTDIVLSMALIQALVATLGSLFFSEVLKYPPCVLCWYQRICMYPLVVMLFIGLMLHDKKISVYALPFSVVGLFIAFYHNLRYYNILPESVQFCQAGVSCTTRYITWFGFLSIPLLSLLAFIIISICLSIHIKLVRKK